MKKFLTILSIIAFLFTIGASLTQAAHFGAVLDKKIRAASSLVHSANKVKFNSCAAGCRRAYPSAADYNNFLHCLSECESRANEKDLLN